jgi:hypothetical protein
MQPGAGGPETAYEHHVFISYRHYGAWPQWVIDHFLPPFQHWLGEELAEDASIFVDTSLETGTRWSRQIERSLARSRVLVPCFSKQYFSSEWCRRELALMLAREAAAGIDPADSLVVPVLIHDGDDLPELARRIQSAKFQELAQPWIANGSLTMEKLSDEIKSWVVDVVSAIRRAPTFDRGWETLAPDDFERQLRGEEPKQTSVPSLGTVT